jgi:putative transposase
MARPLRLEFPGALYHLTSRGHRREDIYVDDADREKFLAILGEACARFGWTCHAYCLMGNHYHLLVETRAATLTKGMRHVNGMSPRWPKSPRRSAAHRPNRSHTMRGYIATATTLLLLLIWMAAIP